MAVRPSREPSWRADDGGVWFPDSPDVRRDLEIIADSGNEVAGTGTRWLEEREA